MKLRLLRERDSSVERIVAGAELLGQLLLQDIERKSGDGDDGVSLKGGVSKDRMVSVHDLEMDQGHKSSRRRFDGHKAAIVVDTDTQLITAVEVLPGNAPDNLGALELVEQSEANTGVPVQEAMGDAAYGDGGTRQAFADAGRRLVAWVPGRPDRQRFPKDDFVIDLAAGSCTCPAGQVTHNIVPAGRRTDAAGRVHHLRAFQFDGSECMTCPLRPQCISAKGRKGRWVLIHPQEALLQQARALQQSTHYDEYRARRVVVEHRLARLVQLGIRQSRYFGRVKTRFQLYLAATVANLTLVAGKLGWPGRTGGGATGRSAVLNIVPLCCRPCCVQFLLGPARTTVVRDSAHVGFTAQIPLPNRDFPARFLEAVKAASELLPDVIVMDVMMPGMDGVEACREILESAPGTRVVMLTASIEEDAVIEAVAAGATGYLQKLSGMDRLVSTLKLVAAGEMPVPPDVVRRVFASIRRGAKAEEDELTGREKEMLVSFCRGMSYHAIAEARGVKPVTIRNGLYSIQSKLGLGTKQEIVVWAVRNGLLDE